MPIERLAGLPDMTKGQAVAPAYDSRDAYVVDLHLNEGCPNEGTPPAATEVVSAKPTSINPSAK